MKHEGTDAVTMSVELAMAWAANPSNQSKPEDVMSFLKTAHSAITDLANGAGNVAGVSAELHQGAVSEKESLASDDVIISLIDGKPYKSLRRHLTAHGMNPDEYRRRYGLAHDYPMVSRTYSVQRSQMAKASGLGRKPS